MDLISLARQNPFHVLNASPADSRETLFEKQWEMALWGENEQGEQALSALLYPQSRLEAEMRWFPCTAGDEIAKLLDFVARPRIIRPVPLFRTDSFLARFNALRLQLTVFPISEVSELSALIHSFATVADALLPAQVMEEINRDREKSGFSPLKRPEELDAPLAGLLRETVQACLSACPAGLNASALETMGKNLKKEMKDRQSPFHNSYLLDLADDEISLWNNSRSARRQKPPEGSHETVQ